MATQAQMRELRDAVEAAIADRVGAESYRRLQREALNGRRFGASGGRSLEFDESGFPISHSPGFFERVRRMLGDR
jgi:hypothetical protein